MSATVEVTGRDIADAVYRVARVTGLDPWSARLIGAELRRRAATGLDWVATATDDQLLVGTTAELRSSTLTAAPAAENPGRVSRRIPVATSDWSLLTGRAARFLVPESALE